MYGFRFQCSDTVSLKFIGGHDEMGGALLFVSSGQSRFVGSCKPSPVCVSFTCCVQVHMYMVCTCVTSTWIIRDVRRSGWESVQAFITLRKGSEDLAGSQFEPQHGPGDLGEASPFSCPSFHFCSGRLVGLIGKTDAGVWEKGKGATACGTLTRCDCPFLPQRSRLDVPSD